MNEKETKDWISFGWLEWAIKDLDRRIEVSATYLENLRKERDDLYSRLIKNLRDRP